MSLKEDFSMTKLITSDIDGTLLLNGAYTLEPEMFDIILELKKKGITFVAASGRQLESMRRLFGPIADEIDYIAENGSLFVHNGEITIISKVERNLAMDILDCIQTKPNCNTMVSGVHTCYVLPDAPDFLHHVQNELNNHTTIVNDFNEIEETIIKIATQDHVDSKSSQQFFHENFHKELKVVASGNDWIDFIPYECSKGTALEIMLEKLKISSEDVMAFGDQQNDLEMLKLAGKSYAMEKAPDSVKAHTTNVTDSVGKILKTLL